VVFSTRVAALATEMRLFSAFAARLIRASGERDRPARKGRLPRALVPVVSFAAGASSQESIDLALSR
jgi:hypothetical protein